MTDIESVTTPSVPTARALGDGFQRLQTTYQMVMDDKLMRTVRGRYRASAFKTMGERMYRIATDLDPTFAAAHAYAKKRVERSVKGPSVTASQATRLSKRLHTQLTRIDHVTRLWHAAKRETLQRRIARYKTDVELAWDMHPLLHPVIQQVRDASARGRVLPCATCTKATPLEFDACVALPLLEHVANILDQTFAGTRLDPLYESAVQRRRCASMLRNPVIVVDGIRYRRDVRGQVYRLE